MTALTALTISAAVALGLVLVVPPSLKVLLAKRLGVDEARAAGLVGALVPALLPLMLAAGFLCDTWGPRQVVLVGSVLTALALFSLTLRNTTQWTLLSVLLIALGAACLCSGSVVLMPDAFFPADAPNRDAAALNLGAVFFSLGGLIAQPLVEVLLRTVRFRWALGVVALLCLVPAGLAVATPPAAASAATAAGSPLAALTHPLVWLAGLAYFLYAPVVSAINTWGTKYLGDVGYRERRARWLLSGFALCFGAAQLGLAYLEASDVLPRGNEPWVVLLLGLLSAVALGNLAGASSRGNAGVGLLLLGAFLGPVFPTLVGFVFQLPGLHNHRGMAFGVVFAVGMVGSLVLGRFVGGSARKRGVPHSFRILMLLALLLTAGALLLGLARSQF
jgi:MFS family permease